MHQGTATESQSFQSMPELFTCSTAPPSLLCSTPAQSSLPRARLTGLPSCLATEATGQDPGNRGRREPRKPPRSPPCSLGSYPPSSSRPALSSQDLWRTEGVSPLLSPGHPPTPGLLLSPVVPSPVPSRMQSPLLGPDLLWLASPRLVIQK